MTTISTSRRVLPPDDHRHGTTAGANAGCHCHACLYARSEYDCTRRRQICYGTWQPFIDAEPVRQHLRQLGAAGLGWQRVATITGVKNGTLSAILYGRPGQQPTKLIRPYLAEKILAVQATPDLIAPSTPVPAVGTVRRLRALVALGYPVRHLAEHLPVQFQTVQRIVSRNPPTVTNEVAKATVVLYDRLWNTVPEGTWVHRRTRRMAEARGWGSPLVWDDATIDDLDATPTVGGDDDRDVDDVLVGEVLAGRAPLSALNEAEESALWRAWERHRRERFLDLPGFVDFARTCNTTAAVAERLRNQADGLNSRGKPRKTTHFDAAARRTSERNAA